MWTSRTHNIEWSDHADYCLVDNLSWSVHQPWNMTALLWNSHVYYQLKEMTTALWTLENLLKWQLWVASKAQWKTLWICVWKCKYIRTRRTCDSCPQGRLAERKRGECFAPLWVSAGAAEVIGFPWGLCLIGRAPEQQPWKMTVLLCNSHVYCRGPAVNRQPGFRRGRS